MELLVIGHKLIPCFYISSLEWQCYSHMHADILQGDPGMKGDKGIPGKNSTHQGINGTKGSKGEEVSEHMN